MKIDMAKNGNKYEIGDEIRDEQKNLENKWGIGNPFIKKIKLKN